MATDMDGTLTLAGKFTPDLLQAFEALQQQGIQVLLVTGRSAGWVSGIINYLNVFGAIAENGGIFYPAQGEPAGHLLTNIEDISSHRQNLEAVFEHLKSHFPQLTPAADNAFRLTDWTFSNPSFSAPVLDRMQELCAEWGWGFTYSSIQCHIKPAQQEKGDALLRVSQQFLNGMMPDQLVTVGDSPNDESLFRSADFPHSVGVANIGAYCDRLRFCPALITTASEGKGFCEFVEWLLERSV